MSFFGIFRKTPDQIAAEAEVRQHEPFGALRVRHAVLLERARVAGLDPNTILLLLQFFGPLIVALVERLLKLIPAA